MNEGDPLNFGLVLSVVAMAVVLATLAVLAAVIGAITRLDRRSQTQPSTAPPPVAVPSASDIAAPELLAVLAAAATAVIGRPIRVRRVVMLGQTKSAWVAGGRSTIMGSHRPHMHKTSGRS